MDADEIIDALGGNNLVADRIGVVRSAVSMWRRHGIPASRCMELAALAKSSRVAGVTLETLLLSMPRVRPNDAGQAEIAPAAAGP